MVQSVHLDCKVREYLKGVHLDASLLAVDITLVQMRLHRSGMCESHPRPGPWHANIERGKRTCYMFYLVHCCFWKASVVAGLQAVVNGCQLDFLMRKSLHSVSHSSVQVDQTVSSGLGTILIFRPRMVHQEAQTLKTVPNH